MDVITQSTLIPISLVITVIVAVLGASKWANAIHSLAKNNEEKISKIEGETGDIKEDLNGMKGKHESIFERLSSIEAKMDIVLKNMMK